MTTAIIGTGTIGSRVARNLAAGGETLIVASNKDADAEALAKQLGRLVTAAPMSEAISAADAVILAVWFDVMKSIIEQSEAVLAGKIIIDPSNAIAPDGKGGFKPTLPPGESAGGIIASIVPKSAHYVKAFGTLSSDSLQSAARRTPERAVLFYATDDAQAETAINHLISASGFDPVKAGGVEAARRIEVFGDLHEFGAIGKPVSLSEAESAIKSVAKS